MITPCIKLFANSRACFTCVISAVHMLDACMLQALFSFRPSAWLGLGVDGLPSAPGAGSPTLLPVRHEHMPARLERTQGAAVGGATPPSSNHHRVSAASGAVPFNRVREHATSARIAHAPGHSNYLMITVPVDTILIIRDLQIFLKKKWCQIMLFSTKGLI